MKDPIIQECIDFLLPIAARLRLERGPDDATVFRLGKALHALMEPKRRQRKDGQGRATQRIKGRLPDGSPVVLDVTKEMIE